MVVSLMASELLALASYSYVSGMAPGHNPEAMGVRGMNALREAE